MNAADTMQLLGDACDLLVAAAAVGCVWTLIEAVLVSRFAGEGAEPGDWHPAVTVLKPLHGDEPGLSDRLSAFCRQDYAGAVQLVLGAGRETESASTIAQRLKLAFPSAAIDLTIDAHEYGSNRKVSNLVNMLPLAQHPVLALSDSDIAVGPHYLRDVVATLTRPDVGAVTCLYHGVAAGGLWARISALAINTHFLPQAVAALSLGLAEPCLGATIALRRDTLDRIGGFLPFADVLADDHAIGVAIRAAGYEVAVPGFTVGHACFDDNAGRYIRRHLRAARTIRSLSPLGYAGTILTHPLPLASLGALGGGTSALIVAAAALASRFVLCRAVERRFGLPRQSGWLILLQDTIALAVYVASFFGSNVHWRGAKFQVAAGGKLVGDRPG